jgi:aconitate hydratase
MPLTFKNPEDYEKVNEGDTLSLTGVYAGMESGEITLKNETTGAIVPLTCSFTDRQTAILKAGSLLSYTKQLGE